METPPCQRSRRSGPLPPPWRLRISLRRSDDPKNIPTEKGGGEGGKHIATVWYHFEKPETPPINKQEFMGSTVTQHQTGFHIDGSGRWPTSTWRSAPERSSAPGRRRHLERGAGGFHWGAVSFCVGEGRRERGEGGGGGGLPLPKGICWYFCPVDHYWTYIFAFFPKGLKQMEVNADGQNPVGMDDSSGTNHLQMLSIHSSSIFHL